jgi:hypothetical protein
VYGTNLAAMPTKGIDLPIGKGRVVRSARAGASQRAAILSIGARLVPACEVRLLLVLLLLLLLLLLHCSMTESTQ